MNKHIELEEKFGAHHYHPLPVVLERGVGTQVWDTEGRQYLDMMSAYSAVSHGHCHPRLVAALCQQAQQLSVVSRAFYSNKLSQFLEKICAMTGQDVALPMNTGAEAVETALKAARKWAYTVKGVPADQAEIITCQGNFHGRTISIIGFSSETQYKYGFGPFPAGFISIPYGDPEALTAAIGPHTAAFLVEPIQGEAGIILPPAGYLKRCAEICKQHNVLLICDEIQTGLGRTGKLLACQHEEVNPDGLILGKALGGGLLPVSAFLAKKTVMDVFRPGDHGSTFGGNPLAATVAYEALTVLEDEKLIEHSARLGEYLLTGLKQLRHPLIKEVRGKGLFVGLEVDIQHISARDICLKLIKHGILSKETHQSVIRFAPPLVINTAEIDFTVQTLEKIFNEL